MQQWLDNGWIRATERSPREVANLLGIAARELSDASLKGISPDGKFDHAYSAIRTLGQLTLHAAGYAAPKGAREHERYIGCLSFTLGDEWAEEVRYFDRCRRMRHQSLYEGSGVARPEDADELLLGAARLHAAVIDWLRATHPDLKLSASE